MPIAGFSKDISNILSPTFSTGVRFRVSSGTPYEVNPHVSNTAGVCPDGAHLNDMIFEISEITARHIVKKL